MNSNVIITTTPAEARAEIARLVSQRSQSPAPTSGAAPTVGLVPTMGALHEGHAALFDKAAAENDVVIASIFVNPLQFGEADDFENYPRTLEDDVELLADHGVALVFAPDTQTMYPGYPDAPAITVRTGQMGEVFEGASRPGHFDGVATVVTKLWNILTPPAPAQFRSYFGQKDAQQLAVLRRTAADFNIPVEIRAVDLVRAPSGLALSSRNTRLDDDGRQRALGLSRALNFLRTAAENGEVLDIAAAREMVAADSEVELDYLEIVDPTNLAPLNPEELTRPLQREALALVAAVVPPVRLIDNMVLPAAH